MTFSLPARQHEFWRSGYGEPKSGPLSPQLQIWFVDGTVASALPPSIARLMETGRPTRKLA
jgi:hypothetical protein